MNRPAKKSIKKAVKRPGGLGQKPKRFRRESRRPNPKVMVQRSGLHGLGLWAQHPIKAGEFLVEYVGQLLTVEENERLLSHTDDPNHTFSFGLDNGLIIDGGVEGNISRYINHSCEPNAEFRETDNNLLFIYATQDIGAGEEIFFDYSLQHGGPYTQALKDQYKCFCGAETCRGTMLDLTYKAPRTPRERVEELEALTEQLMERTDTQTKILRDQAELITKLSEQVLHLSKLVLGVPQQDEMSEVPQEVPSDAPVDGHPVVQYDAPIAASEPADDALVDRLLDAVLGEAAPAPADPAPATEKPRTFVPRQRGRITR